MNNAMGLAGFDETQMDVAKRQVSPKTLQGIGSVTYDDLARAGRFGDRFLAHVQDGETIVPKVVLENNPYIRDKIYGEMRDMGLDPADYTVNGGDLTNVNPKTNLPEFGLFKSLKKLVKKAAKIVLPIAATVACGGNPACGAAASAALTKAQGGSWGDALKSAAFTYAGQSFAQGMGSSFAATDAAGNTLTGWDAISTGLNPISATGGLQMPTALTPGSTIGNQAGGVQGFFQGLGGATRAAFTPGVTMGQGFSGTTIGSGGITAAGPQYFGSEAVDLSKMSPAAQDAYRSAAAQAMNTGASQSEIVSAGMTAAQQAEAAARGAVASQPSFLEKLVGKGAEEKAKSSLLSSAASFAIPALATYLTAGQEIPESEAAKYDAQVRQEISDYNSCIRGGGQNCNVPSALAPRAGQINVGYAPGSLYGRMAQTKGIPAATSVRPVAMQGVQSRPLALTGVPSLMNTQGRVMAKAGGHINGPGTGTSDSIPAMLSDGEFVMTANAVRGAGNGSREKGVERMYKMMRQFEGAA